MAKIYALSSDFNFHCFSNNVYAEEVWDFGDKIYVRLSSIEKMSSIYAACRFSTDCLNKLGKDFQGVLGYIGVIGDNWIVWERVSD